MLFLSLLKKFPPLASAMLVSAVAGIALFAQDASQTAPAGNAAKGRRAFLSNCTSCHAIADENRATGPSLHGVLGRRAGAREGYAYSPAMKDSQKIWDAALLEKYLAKPDAVFPGTPMTLGISLPAMRAYLKTLSDGGKK